MKQRYATLKDALETMTQRGDTLYRQGRISGHNTDVIAFWNPRTQRIECGDGATRAEAEEIARTWPREEQ